MVIFLTGCQKNEKVWIVDGTQAANEKSLTVDLFPTIDGGGMFYNAVDAVFTNHHPTQHIRLLTPIDGSYACWIMPYYDVQIHDKSGNALRKGARCSHYGAVWSERPDWPEQYIVDLGPGESHREAVHVSHEVTAKHGEYDVRFRYEFQPKTGEETKSGPYPPNVWTGAITSAPIRVTFKEPEH